MKGIDLFCASQASTAINHSLMDEKGSSSSATAIGGRKIDRYNPIIRDERRSASSRALANPCSSPKLPISPKPYSHLRRNRPKKTQKSNAKKQADQIRNGTSSAEQSGKQSNAKQSGKQRITEQSVETRRFNFSKPSAFLYTFKSPPGSSRYLLSDAGQPTFDVVSDFDRVLTLVPIESNSFDEDIAIEQSKSSDEDITVEHDEDITIVQDYEPPASKANPFSSSITVEHDEDITIVQDYEPPASKANPFSSSSSSSTSNPDQVVDLRVSLHCKGCAGKVRKHISRMQGVTSFNIDFAAKKVTVTGNITPLEVLASISKVKSAQLWTPGMSSASPAFVSSNWTKT